MNIHQRENVGKGVMILMITAVFLVVAVAPTMAAAARWSDTDGKRAMPGHKHHRPILGIWQDSQMIRNLELTKEQIQQLRDADFAHREKHLALRSELDKLRLQMEMAFSNPVVDQKVILQLAQKTADVNGKMFVQKIEARLGLDSVLSADQIQKLKQLPMSQKRRGPKAGKPHHVER